MIYSILPGVVAIYFVIMSIVVFRSATPGPTRTALLGLLLTSVVWQGSWAILFQSTDPLTIDLMVRLGYLLILFLPTTLYHFLAALADAKSERKYIIGSYLLALSLAMLLPGDLFVAGYYDYHFGPYPMAGVLHPIHVLQTMIVVSRGLWLAWQAQKPAYEPKRSQLRYSVLALLIYTVAAVDYAVNYGVAFYPPGIFFISVALTLIVVAMVKKDLLDIHLVLSKYTSRLIVGLMVLVSFGTVNLLVQDINIILISNIALAFIWGRYGAKLLTEVESRAQKKWLNNYYDAPEVIVRISNELAPLLDKPAIITHVAEAIASTLGIKQYKIDDSFAKPTLPNSNVFPIRSSHKIEANLILIGNINRKDQQLLDVLLEQTTAFLDRADKHHALLEEAETVQNQKALVSMAMAGDMAHGLRSPLSTITTTTKGLSEYLPSLFAGYRHYREQNNNQIAGDTITDDRLNRLESSLLGIEHSVNNAQHIIGTLLDNVSSDEQQTSKLEDHSILACIDKAIANYPFNEDEKNKLIVLRSDDFTFHGSDTLMQYVLHNLLNNALYSITKANLGNIMIQMERGDRYNKLYFIDSGPGIEQENLAEIFNEAFTTKPENAGKGMGLPFVKRVITSLGGTIECQSEPGCYTTFTIRLPNKQ